MASISSEKSLTMLKLQVNDKQILSFLTQENIAICTARGKNNPFS